MKEGLWESKPKSTKAAEDIVFNPESWMPSTENDLSNKDEFKKDEVLLENVSNPEQFIEAVNFKSLNEIFDSIIRKSGREHIDESEWILPNNVSVETELSGAGGSANIVNRNIKLSGKIIAKQEKEGAPAGLAALHILVHEMTHLRGRSESEYPSVEEMKNVDGREVKITSGLQQKTISLKDGRQENIGLSLNEAITEEIALEVLFEYLQRMGTKELVTDETVRKNLNTAYTYDRILFSVLTRTLARDLEIDEKTVRQAFVQAYMNGDEEPKKVMIELLTQITREPERIPGLMLISNENVIDQEHLEFAESKTDPAIFEKAVEDVISRVDLSQIESALKLS